MNSKTKKILIALGIIVFMAFVIVIFSLNGKSGFKEITYKEFDKKINNKETFVLVIEQEGCTHCIEYSPKIKQITNEYGITIYFVETNKFSESDYKKFSDKYEFSGTPTTIFIKDGEEKIMSRIVGAVSKEKVIETLKNNGYIK